MRWFLIASFTVLAFALLLVVGVFVYVNLIMGTSSPAGAGLSERSASATDSVQVVSTSSRSLDEGETDLIVPREEIPLRSLPLTDGQREVATLAGIDIETFVITPAMLSCVEWRLGTERLNAIIAGEAPSVLETARILPCLSSD